ncbi:MAG: PINc/VapC family ATPase [Sulfolobaceae archaeon]
MIDKSALLIGLSKYVERGLVVGNFLVHRSLLEELEKESQNGLLTAEVALEELRKVSELTERLLLGFEVVGDAKGGKVEEIIRDYCLKHKCTILTADEIQKKIAEIMRIDVIYLKPLDEQLSIEKFFDESTMSVHLKEGTTPKVKKGKPGSWSFVELSTQPITASEIKKIVAEILTATKVFKDSFIEVERKGSTIIQLGKYRVVVTRPPLSDGWEVTITRPVTRKTLEDYNISEQLIKRFKEKAEGIVIAGAPGMGKTTFAQALAEFYMRLGKVVKTIESPRDMFLPPEISQYSKNYAEIGELHDILLLSRPDYTVYDEMRNDEDFKLYVDLRLAGIGMIGVVHATSPIDAIHRFVNRVDIGTIPNILDTVIFIHSGEVKKVYTLEMTVKVPTGLREADLARPVVEVKDYITNTVEYEIYVFGEQTMIVPIRKVSRQDNIMNKIKMALENSIPDAKVEYENGEYVIIIPKTSIPVFNRKIVSKIRRLEKKLGIKTKIKFQESS